MTVLITGGYGLLGTAITEALRAKGHRVVVATRSQNQRTSADTDLIHWDPELGTINLESLGNLDAVIHLAGEPIANGRWTKRKKHRILESRRLGTRTIANAMAALPNKPRVLISASGINYYANASPDNDASITEDAPAGSDFLSQVCQAWEKETQPAIDAGIRVVRARLGLVLTVKGGALARMLPAFKLGFGGNLGHGRQHMSWIALQDVVQIFAQALEDPRFEGPVNVVSPNPVTNAEFTRCLARHLHRWRFAPLPAPALKLIFGEMAQATLLADLAVTPARLQELGYTFSAPSLEEALRLE